MDFSEHSKKIVAGSIVAVIVVAVILISASLGFLTTSAALGASTTSGSAPLTVTFTLNPVGCCYSTPPLTYTVYYGDGTSNTATQNSGQVTFTHTYSNAGSYSAYGTVQDSGTAYGSSTPYTITVNPASVTSTTQSLSCTSNLQIGQTGTCTAAVSPSGASGTVSFSVFQGQPITFPSGSSCILSFGSCAVQIQAGSEAGSSTILGAYPGNSNYGYSYGYSNSITITSTTTQATSSTQTTTSSTSSGTITSVQIATNPSTPSGFSPFTVNFAALVSASSGAVYTCSWTFGDGSTGTGTTAQHIYTSAGTFSAQVTCTATSGSSQGANTIVLVSAPTTSTTQSPVTSSVTSTFTTVKSGSTITTTSTGIVISNPVVSVAVWPPGLNQGWNVGNVSVGATSLSTPIYLSNGLNVTGITCSAPISHTAYSSTIIQIEFSQSVPASCTILTAQAPKVVYADANQISSWTFANGVLQISGDPSTFTIYFSNPSGSGGQSLTPLDSIALIAIVITIVSVTGIVAIRRR